MAADPMTTDDFLDRAFVVVRGLVYSAGFVGLWWWLAVVVRRYDDALPFTVPAGLAPLGVVLVVVGAGLAASCIATFLLRGKGTPAPFDPPRVFVASGPYRLVRNPMYLGAAGVTAGAALIVRSPAILLLTLGFLLLMHLFVIAYEEPATRRRFGQSYVEYTRTTRRWLPGLPRRRP